MGKLAILACGGPAPGINSVIAAATIRACLSGYSVLGIQDGFRHIMEGDASRVLPLDIHTTSRIHFRGGSFIGISRGSPLAAPGKMQNTLNVLRELDVTMLITIGGDGTAYVASKLADASGGALRVVHVPKTIDNDIDLPFDVPTFGFQTARHVGVGIVENLMVDAKTTGRWYFVVAQGRNAGHLALAIGKAAGATLSLIPEEFPKGIPLATVVDTLVGAMVKRVADGNRRHGIALIAEGLSEVIRAEDLEQYRELPRDAHGNLSYANVRLADILEDAARKRIASLGVPLTIQAKEVGYELRCADPIPFDIEYTRDLGYCAAKFILEGGTQAMVSMQNGRFEPIPFADLVDPASGKARVRMVDLTSDRYKIARSYMVRLRWSDMEDPGTLARLASVTNLSPSEFLAAFGAVVQSDGPSSLVPPAMRRAQ